MDEVNPVKRVLVCANPDLNLIDGSSIWLQTITLAISATKKTNVDFIAKSLPERDELFQPLADASDINIINGTDKKYWKGKGFRRLTLPMMAELAKKLDELEPYDVIIIRGTEIATSLLNYPYLLSKCWLYLTDIPQSLDEYPDESREVMKRLATGSARLLCQTAGFRELWHALVPDLSADKTSIYSPVIPDFSPEEVPVEKRPPVAIYAGKFKSDWMTLEMASAWASLQPRQPANSEFIMIGDKIHDEPDRAAYKQEMTSALEATPNLLWKGAMSRELVQEELRNARVGLSWRAESMNATVEYSTKILEYGGAGCAAILNRNPLHEKLLGHDYPLFANSEEEFKDCLMLALTDDEICSRAAIRLKVLASDHTFSSRVLTLAEWLDEMPPVKSLQKKVVLVAGHDLKFFKLLQKSLERSGHYDFIIDQWQGHNKHDEEKSRALLEKADIVFCEWCLGNLKWYSHNKLPRQKLVARLHLQENGLPYFQESNWDAIDHIAFVSEHTRQEGLEAVHFPKEKTSVIPNLLDTSKFSPLKKFGDARYTLGIIGVVPRRKRLDRAIDLLEELLKVDDRYCLRVKGKNPLDYDWLLKREDEMTYYRDIFERINSSPSLRYKVIFDSPGDNVNEWLSMIGFLLSPSDFESFHMAIGEGMMTGSIPIIWNWEGASQIWPKKYVVDSTQNAAELLQTFTDADNSECIQHVGNRYSADIISSKWNSLLCASI